MQAKTNLVNINIMSSEQQLLELEGLWDHFIETTPYYNLWTANELRSRFLRIIQTMEIEHSQALEMLRKQHFDELAEIASALYEDYETEEEEEDTAPPPTPSPTPTPTPPPQCEERFPGLGRRLDEDDRDPCC